MEYLIAQKLSVVNPDINEVLIGTGANSLAEKRLRSLIESDIRREQAEKNEEKKVRLPIANTSPQRASSNLKKAIQRPGALEPTPVPERSDVLGLAASLGDAPDNETGTILYRMFTLTF